MDPNANLREQRAIIAKMWDCDHSDCACLHDGDRLAELADALDNWLKAGGFLPTEWGMRA